ncbi:hypothetical protein IJ732_02690 [bacterium]|nr:hypothetical protein [bacterium]
MKRLAIFAHWDKDSLIEDYVLQYLKGLKSVAEKIIFVSDCDIKQLEQKKLDGLADYVIAKQHGEYDFGSYKRGFLYAQENNFLNDVNELILANDSCYAPLFPLEDMFNEMSEKTNFWGIIKHSYCDREHLQSFFIVLDNNVFNSIAFRNFINSVCKQNSKWDVISKYEVGLTETLVSAKFSYSEYCKGYDLLFGPPNFYWKKLIKINKNPFLKTSLIRLNNSNKIYPIGWKRFLKKYTNYPVELIEKDLLRNQKSLSIINHILLCLNSLRRSVIKIHFNTGEIVFCEKILKLKGKK